MPRAQSPAQNRSDGEGSSSDGPVPAPVGAGPARRDRLLGPDVVRAVALWGVVVLNYHGYLNGVESDTTSSRAEVIFDHWLSSRFAATFVLTAGVGVTLLTNRSRLSGDRTAITADRWRLARRGLLLFTVGYFLEWPWSGTIIFFYGAYFMVAALMITLRTRWLVVIATACAVGAAGLHTWVVDRAAHGHDVSAFDPIGPLRPQDLIVRTFVGWTHPLLPWLAFLCAGMILGRSIRTLPSFRLRLLGGAIVVAAACYLIATTLPHDSAVWQTTRSVLDQDRSLLYTLSTLAIALAAYVSVSWVADSWPASPLTTFLAAAGRMTLTIYFAHVVIFRLLVDATNVIRPSGLDQALVFGTVTFVALVLASGIWQRRYGSGPLERVYRAFGG